MPSNLAIHLSSFIQCRNGHTHPILLHFEPFQFENSKPIKNASTTNEKAILKEEEKKERKKERKGKKKKNKQIGKKNNRKKNKRKKKESERKSF